MVAEILRILDKTIIFSVVFSIINLIKIVCSSIVLYKLNSNYDNEDSRLVLLLFITQNFIEACYLLTKLMQTLGKQKKVLLMYSAGKEITYNPYEAGLFDRILEVTYYMIML